MIQALPCKWWPGPIRGQYRGPWIVSTNQSTVLRSLTSHNQSEASTKVSDQSRPIRGQYWGHMTSLDQSEASIEVTWSVSSLLDRSWDGQVNCLNFCKGLESKRSWAKAWLKHLSNCQATQLNLFLRLPWKWNALPRIRKHSIRCKI